VEHKNPLREPKLADVLTNLRLEDLDLVLVEGFKQEAIPKIELHRSGMNRPLLFPSDPNVVAIACDYEIDPGDRPVTTLDINNIQQISHFIRQYMPNRRVAAIR
jgi:molybdopterin-guanine dinucleotide biosynthesis protein MobB